MSKTGYLVLILLIFIIIPFSYASENTTDVLAHDEHTGDEGYIKFDKDTISVEEGEKYYIYGEVVLYDDWDGPMYCWDPVNVNCSYTDANGNYQEIIFLHDAMDERGGFYFDIDNAVGLEKRNSPYVLTFDLVRDDLYDDAFWLMDEFKPSWVVLYYGVSQPVDPIIPDEPTIAGTLYVDGEKGSDSYDGSETAPFKTIKKALDENIDLGGNYEIIVNEGEYDLINYQNSPKNGANASFTLKGNGTVVINSDDSNYHIFLMGTTPYIVRFIGLTFTKGGNSAISVSSTVNGLGEKANEGKELIITNCTFINNHGLNGAIRSYAKTIITNSTFLNNNADGSNGAYQSLISIMDNALLMNNCILINNTVLSGQPLIYSDDVGCLVDYNFWGDNNLPEKNDLSKRVIYDNWSVIALSLEDAHYIAGGTYELNIEFMQTDGDSIKKLDSSMPDLSVDLTCDKGEVPLTATVTSNRVTVNYLAKLRGEDKIFVSINGKIITSITVNVDVSELDKIYVSPTGSNSASGDMNHPLKTIASALIINKALGGNKTIIVTDGVYNESDIKIEDIVTIIGDGNVIVNASFKILNSSDIYNITFINSINHTSCQLNIFNSIFKDTSCITSSGVLNIYDSQFINIALYSMLKTRIINSTFTNNQIIIKNNEINIINSTFRLNKNISFTKAAVCIINNTFVENNMNILNVSSLNMTGNRFDGNGGEIYITNSTLDNNVYNNSFGMDKLHIINSTADLKNNTINTIIQLNNSKITNAVIIFMDNKTAKFDSGIICLNVIVTDDMSNLIDGGKVTFTSIGDVSVINGSGSIEYEFVKGDYVISGTYDSCDYSLIKTGIIRVDVTNYWFINGTGFETLQEAVDAAGLNDIIKGVSGIIEEKMTRIGHRTRPDEPWVVNKNITITSVDSSPVTIKALERYIINIDYYSNVTFENIIFTGAYNPDGWGGAIHSMGKNTITINNCTFINNTANDGGAIHSYGNLYISNCDFINNTATVYGGAVFKDGDGDFYMENARFINNSAYTYAGAIYAMGYSDVVQVFKNVLFDSNTATCGGAVFAHGKNMTFIECDFINNQAVDKQSGYNPLGGAVYAHDGLTRFYKVNFQNNYAECNGGALQLDNSILSILDSEGRHITIYLAILENCTIKNNIALGEGGAIYTGDELITHVNLTNVLIENNTASNACGYVNLYGFYNLNNVTFKDNKNTDGDELIYSYGYNDGIQTFYSDNFITNSKFINNVVKTLIKVTSDYSNLTVANSVFEKQSKILDNYGINTILINNSVINPTGKYSIENQGRLFLSNNTLINPIFNNGIITSKTYVTILDNKTVRSPVGSVVLLKAVIEDDNKNRIINDEFVFITNSKAIKPALINNEYAANYTVIGGKQIIDGDCGENLLNISHKTGLIDSEFEIGYIDVVVENITVGDIERIIIGLPEDATGNVVLNLNGNNYTTAVKNGIATFDFTNLTIGDYFVNVTYSGDNKYMSISSASIFSVIDEYYIIINASDVEKYYMGSERFIVNIYDNHNNPIINASVNIVLNGVEYNKWTNANGRAGISLGLNSGNYTVTTSYGNISVNSTVIIKSTVEGNDLVKVFRNASRFSAKFMDSNGELITNTTVTFNINGIYYNRTTNSKGIANLNINLAQGKYIITAINPISGEMHTNDITVLPTIIENRDVEMYYRNGTQYLVKLVDSKGNVVGKGVNVTFNINGMLYERSTNTNGIARLNLNLQPSSYIITAEYLDCRVSNSIKILPVLSANDLKMSYMDGSRFEAKLLDGRGSPVKGKIITFNINGMFYDKTTDVDGIARLNINLISGNYIITSSYNGVNVASKITIS